MKATDHDWSLFARVNPYFAVWTEDRFRNGQLDEAARREFFASGAGHVDDVLALVRRHVAPDFAPGRALDFGCGVGRVTLPLARHCREVVGVDVAEPMLRLAEANAQDAGIANARFVRGDDTLSAADGPFDFVHSHIVFQHVPVRRGLALLDCLLGKLAVGGVGALHFTHDSTPARRMWDRSRPWRGRVKRLLGPALAAAYRLRAVVAPSMQMNEYPLSALFGRLFDAGARGTWAEQTDHDGHRGLILVFRKADPAAWRPCR